MIATARLRLRRARMEDLDDLHMILSHRTAMRYWSTPPHTARGQTQAWLREMIAAPADLSDDYVVEYQGRVIGKAGCWRVPEIGYIFHPDVWGKGLAREALEALIPRLFAAWGMQAITADVDPRNAASLGLLARLGFAETHRAARTWEVGGAWCDSIYLSLPASTQR